MAGKDINCSTFSTPEQISICCPGTFLTHEKQRNIQLKVKSLGHTVRVDEVIILTLLHLTQKMISDNSTDMSKKLRQVINCAYPLATAVRLMSTL